VLTNDLRTSTDMLSCGMASAPVLHVLLRHDVHSVVVSEDQFRTAGDLRWRLHDIATTPSGAAGLAGVLKVASETQLRDLCRLTADSAVLLVITEGRATESTRGLSDLDRHA